MERKKRGKIPKIRVIKPTSDPITALELFPAEIWSHILATKLQWKDPLEPIGSHFYDFAVTEEEQQWHSETLALREVCPAFQQVLDSYLDANPFNYVFTHDHYIIDDEPEAKYAKLTNQYAFKFDNPERLENFVKYFQTSDGKEKETRNPFIGRRISLEESKYHYKTKLKAQEARQLCERMWNGFTNVLTLYGQHVWFCSVEIEDKFPTRVDYMNTIRKWLELMPNLRVFKLRYSRDLGSWGGMLGKSKHVNPTSSELKELEKEVAANPFPKLEHLKFLKLDSLPYPIFNGLIAGNNHISRLEVTRDKNHSKYEFPVEMQNLTQLSLELKSTEDVQRLDKFAKFWPRLTKLHLPYQPVTPKYTQFAEWVHYLEMINKNWGNSKHLKDLTIQLPLLKESPEEYLGQLNLLRLELPDLKRVKIIMDSACSLDLLLKCRDSLELLDVYGNYNELEHLWKARWRSLVRLGPADRYIWDDDTSLVGTVQWLGKEEYMYKSNIWDLFPKLRKITVEAQTRHVGPMRYNVMEFFREKLEKKRQKENGRVETDEVEDDVENENDVQDEDDIEDEDGVEQIDDEEVEEEDEEGQNEEEDQEEEEDQDESDEDQDDSSESEDDLFGFGDNTYSLRRQHPMFSFP